MQRSKLAQEVIADLQTVANNGAVIPLTLIPIVTRMLMACTADQLSLAGWTCSLQKQVPLVLLFTA